MKKQKKFGRKLALNKETIASLDQTGTRRVIGGADPIPCNRTVPTEVICTVYDCYTDTCVGCTDTCNCPLPTLFDETCNTCHTDCGTCQKTVCGSCFTCEGAPCPG